MSAPAITPYRPGQRPGGDDFAHLLRAEWTKFRTVRGWVIANLGSLDPRWQHRLQEWGPMTAGMAIQATKALKTLPIGPWPGLGVLALWAAGALLLGGLLLRLRDA